MRCLDKQPYCRCGVTLVAINLYEPIDSYKPGGENALIYSQETMERYKAQTDRDQETPHIWSLASHCFKRVFEKGDQSIVITGESGAGKTFNTKQILDFLANIGGKPVPEGVVKITDLMLSSTPILEGFGNANMPRNPDSSRFGKLYKVFVHPSSRQITGIQVN